MSFDTILHHARIVDGSGAPAFDGDVGLRGASVAAVGDLSAAEAETHIDAAGRYLTPGFIDIHRHADVALLRPGFGKAELAQGLTTLINGNCGLSAAPIMGAHSEEQAAYLAPILGDLPDRLRFASLGEYLAAAKQANPPLNQAMLIGMGTLRSCVAGFADGDLEGDALRALHRLLERALADGAVGVSLGLGYAPDCFYSTEGLLRALAPLRGSGVPLTVHMRQEGDGVVDALREMLYVGRALNTPLEISHLKAIGRRNWRRAVPEMLRLIAHARADGQDVLCDAYPYTAGCTQLIHVLPPEFQRGGAAALTEALRDNAARRRMRERMESGSDFENITLLVGFENVYACSLRRSEHLAFEGLSVAEIAARTGKDPFDALFDLLAAEDCAPAMIDSIVCEEDLEEILRAPFSGAASDATYPAAGLPHPRVYGAFVRLLETYVREKKLLSLEAAVHKVTLQPAERLRLRKKGRIAVGMDADLCLFDLRNVHEAGTFADPAQLARGMDAVFVGGVLRHGGDNACFPAAKQV